MPCQLAWSPRWPERARPWAEWPRSRRAEFRDATRGSMPIGNRNSRGRQCAVWDDALDPLRRGLSIEDQRQTFAVLELALSPAYRRCRIARRLPDALLAGCRRGSRQVERARRRRRGVLRLPIVGIPSHRRLPRYWITKRSLSGFGPPVATAGGRSLNAAVPMVQFGFPCRPVGTLVRSVCAGVVSRSDQ